MKWNLLIAFAVSITSSTFSNHCSGHDTWVEVSSSEIRHGQVVYIDLKLGNHGNEHRDFKLASKITLAPCTLEVRDCSGTAFNLKDKVVDTGFAPKEGYWSARFVPRESGVHVVWHTLDTLHGTIRAIKSSKACFVVGNPSEHKGATGLDQPLGGAIEIVPLSHPALVAAGQPIAVQVIFQGKPLPNARIAFIPRGQVLAEGFDSTFERRTDAAGRAEFIPTEGNRLLVVVHHMAPDEKGDGYDKTAYSATMTFDVAESLP